MLFHHLRCTIFQLRTDLIRLLSNQFKQLGAGLTLTLLITGCQGLPTWISPQRSSAPVDLSISQISAGTGGSYAISGSAILPNATQLTVAAIRYLNAASSSAPPSYAILDRQVATVSDGHWDARLNLWQSSAQGQLQESWQTDSATASATPEPTVTFLVTVDPPHQQTDLKQQVEALSPSAQATLSRFTTDGELYLQTSKLLTVPPPQVSITTVPSPIAPNPVQVTVVAPSLNSAAQPARSSDLPLTPDASFR